MILIIIKEFNFDEFDSSSVHKKKKEKLCFLTLILIKKKINKLDRCQIHWTKGEGNRMGNSCC